MAGSSAPLAPEHEPHRAGTLPLTRRDRGLLAAVAAGRARLIGGQFPRLLVDDRDVCDQLAAYQLLARGLIAARPGEGGRAELTPVGWAALRAAAAKG